MEQHHAEAATSVGQPDEAPSSHPLQTALIMFIYLSIINNNSYGQKALEVLALEVLVGGKFIGIGTRMVWGIEAIVNLWGWP